MVKRRFLLTAVLALLLVMLAAVARPVYAHAVPVRSQPAANATLEEPPAEVVIEFNEPVVAELSTITVLTQVGEQAAGGAVEVVDEATLRIPLPALNQGAYLVSWRVLSAVDGHTTSGTFSFGVGVAAADAGEGGGTVTARLSILSILARGLTLTGIILLIGFFAFRFFIWRPIVRGEELEAAEAEVDREHGRRSLQISLFAVTLLALSLLLTLFDQAQTFQLLQPGNLTTWLGTRFGQMWAARLLLTTVLWGVLLLGIKDEGQRMKDEGRKMKDSVPHPSALILQPLSLLLAVAIAVTNALTSHSAALLEGGAAAILVDLGHTLAAGVWVGGLLALALAMWLARGLAAESRMWLGLNLILNFSALAATAIGILLLSGGYLSWQHIRTWSALVGTAYGRTLLVKLALALLAILLAAFNLLYLKPRLDRLYEEPETAAAKTAVRRFRVVVTAEAIIAVLILFSAALLSDLQRAADAPPLADEANLLFLEQTVDDLDVTLTLNPALVGNNYFEVILRDANGAPVDGAEVSLRFSFLGQALGADSGEAIPHGNGGYHLEGSYISLSGPWQVEVAIRRPGQFDTFVPFRLDAAIGGSIRSAEVGPGPLERFARFMTIGGGLATGAGMVLLAIGWGFVAIRAANREWQLVPLLLVSILLFWLGSTQLFTFFDEEFTPARFLNNPILPDAQSVAQGQALYDQYCVACHGEEGKGDGPGAANLSPPPADFGSGHTDTHPDGDLYYWIRNGIEETAMPPFEDELTNEETWHLVNYVRRLSATAAQMQVSN